MKNIIRAEFDTTDMAEYAVRHIKESFDGVSGQITQKSSSHDRYYSYTGRIPSDVPLAVPYSQTINNVFVPSFPENSTINDIKNKRSAYMEITCESCDTAAVKSQIMSLGGSVRH